MHAYMFIYHMLCSGVTEAAGPGRSINLLPTSLVSRDYMPPILYYYKSTKTKHISFKHLLRKRRR